jgi:uncharacterized membrane protein
LEDDRIVEQPISSSQTEESRLQPVKPERVRGSDWLLLAGGLMVVVAALVLSPGGLLDKADHVGYAVCHQIPLRSFFFDGRQLPLCARCSGQFLGALLGLGLLVLLGRSRAGRLPAAPVVLVLLGFFALWVLDGLNSYLSLLELPHLYQPHNLLRVTTGALQGVALIVLVLPFFNVSFWARPTAQRSLASLREVALLLLMVAAIAALVSSEVDALLYPVALASTGGTLMMLVLVNTMLVTLALRREGQVTSWRSAMPLLVAGLALGTVELIALNLVRATLTSTLGLPF